MMFIRIFLKKKKLKGLIPSAPSPKLTSCFAILEKVREILQVLP